MESTGSLRFLGWYQHQKLTINQKSQITGIEIDLRINCFNNFKKEQQKCSKQCFLICKNMTQIPSCAYSYLKKE